MSAPLSELVVPTRFCGPPRSGNGGWTAGALAARALGSTGPHGPIQVTLRVPPPLETPMDVRGEDGRTLLEHAGSVVAEAVVVDGELTQVPATDTVRAAEAAGRHPGTGLTTYEVCFACGPGREPGDGLRIFPGPLASDDRVAAPWTPHPSTGDGAHVDLACTWAALDCIGGWSDDLVNRPMLLGRMTAAVHALPRIGEEHVLVGRLLRRDGRRSFTASTLWTAEGTELARAEHVWFAVDPSAYH